MGKPALEQLASEVATHHANCIGIPILSGLVQYNFMRQVANTAQFILPLRNIGMIENIDIPICPFPQLCSYVFNSLSFILGQTNNFKTFI